MLPTPAALTEFNVSHVTKLEKWIDELDDKLPPLTNFILPVRGMYYILCCVIFFFCSLEAKQVHFFTCLEQFVVGQKEGMQK